MFFKQLIVMILHLEKPYYCYFFTHIIPAFNFTTLSIFFILGHLIALFITSFLWILYLKEALLSLLFYTQNHSFIAHDFFLQNLYPYSFPTFYGRALGSLVPAA